MTGAFLCSLQKMHASSQGFLLHGFGPQGRMDFADVGLPEEEHADPGLADASADGQGQPVLEDGLLERKGSSVLAAGFLQLGSE